MRVGCISIYKGEGASGVRQAFRFWFLDSIFPRRSIDLENTQRLYIFGYMSEVARRIVELNGLKETSHLHKMFQNFTFMKVDLYSWPYPIIEWSTQSYALMILFINTIIHNGWWNPLELNLWKSYTRRANLFWAMHGPTQSSRKLEWSAHYEYFQETRLFRFYFVSLKTDRKETHLFRFYFVSLGTVRKNVARW